MTNGKKSLLTTKSDTSQLFNRSFIPFILKQILCLNIDVFEVKLDSVLKGTLVFHICQILIELLIIFSFHLHFQIKYLKSLETVFQNSFLLQSSKFFIQKVFQIFPFLARKQKLCSKVIYLMLEVRFNKTFRKIN